MSTKKRRKVPRIGAGLLLSLALAVLLAACGGGDDDETGGSGQTAVSASDCSKLEVMTWEGYAEDEWVKPFEEETGVQIVPTYISSEDEGFAKVQAGGGRQFDLVAVTSNQSEEMVKGEFIKPLDESRFTNFDALFDFAKDAPYVIDGERYAVPFAWGINGFLYNTEEFESPPKSWEAYTADNLADSAAVWTAYDTLFIGATLLGYGEDVDNLSQEQLDEIVDYMAANIGPNVKTTWSTPGDLIQAFQSGEVKAALSWPYMYAQLLQQGAPVGFAIFPEHGAHAWTDAYGISPSIDPGCEEAAYAFIDSMIDPEVGAQGATVAGWSPTSAEAVALIPEKLHESLLLVDPEKKMATVDWKPNLERDVRQRYIDAMNELLAQFE